MESESRCSLEPDGPRQKNTMKAKAFYFVKLLRGCASKYHYK